MLTFICHRETKIKKLFYIAFLSFFLTACSDPKSATLSNIQDLEKHKEVLQKLTEEEKDLLTGYVMRKEAGKVFGDGEGIPQNTKIGDAINEQRNFKEEYAKK